MIIFDLNLENLPIDVQVKTRKGFVWTHINADSWKDETSGLTWLPECREKYTHKQAMNLETDKQRLPTKEEFEEAEKHGIREIFQMQYKWFWSASVHPKYSDYAYGFYGNSGCIDYGSRDVGVGSVRCMGR